MPVHPLPDAALLRFSGDDAGTFLHGQLTSDVKGLETGRSQYSGYCTPKGRLLASFLLWRDAEGYGMQLPAALAESVRKRLSMFILRAKVAVRDMSAEFACLGVAGDDAESIVARAAGSVPAAHGCVTAGASTAICLPGVRYLLVVPHAEAVKLAASNAGPAAEWARREIHSGIAAILPQTQEEFVPQMVNFDLIGALSYTKGCYPGQEIVARTHYLGRLKQRLYRAHIDGAEAPRPGDRLFSADLGDQASGMIVNAAPAAGRGFDVLAVIQTASAAAQPIHWQRPDGPVLRIEPLPYAVPL